MNRKELIMIAVFILSITVIIVAIPLLHKKYYEANKICDTILKVYVCGGYKNNSECRVELSNGTRVTTNKLVADGDTYCWLP